MLVVLEEIFDEENIMEYWVDITNNNFHYVYRTSSAGMTPHGYMDIEAKVNFFEMVEKLKKYLSDNYYEVRFITLGYNFSRCLTVKDRDGNTIETNYGSTDYDLIESFLKGDN